MVSPFIQSISELEPTIQEQTKEQYKKEFIYPDTLNWGSWVGFACQQPFYTFQYKKEDPATFLITEDGNENTYTLNIPYDHMLNLVTFSRTHTDSEALEVRYIPSNTSEEYYDILYSNSALTARSVVIELGERYENVGGKGAKGGASRLQFVITGTNTKKWKPRVNLRFLKQVS